MSTDATMHNTDGEWQVIQPLTNDEKAEHESIAQQQPLQTSGSGEAEMEIDQGGGESPISGAGDISVEERRLADSNTGGGSSIAPSASPASSLDASPTSSPEAAAVTNAEQQGIEEQARLAEQQRRVIDAAAAAEKKRQAERTPVLYRMDCSKCGATLQFPFPSRLVHCAVCTHINAVSLARAVEHSSNPLPDKSLPEQAAQWTTQQVVVFLKSLKLDHLIEIFENNHVDGAQLLELTYYDVRDILRIQKPVDIENVLNCTSILRGSRGPVATPMDLLMQGGGNTDVGPGAGAAPMDLSSSVPAVRVNMAIPQPAIAVAAPVAATPVQSVIVPVPTPLASESSTPSISSSTAPFQSSIAGVGIPTSGNPAASSPVDLASIATQAGSTIGGSQSNGGGNGGGSGLSSQLPRSPQGSTASMQHFANIPATTKQGTTEHAREVLAQAANEPLGAADQEGNDPMVQ